MRVCPAQGAERRPVQGGDLPGGQDDGGAGHRPHQQHRLLCVGWAAWQGGPAWPSKDWRGARLLGTVAAGTAPLQTSPPSNPSRPDLQPTSCSGRSAFRATLRCSGRCIRSPSSAASVRRAGSGLGERTWRPCRAGMEGAGLPVTWPALHVCSPLGYVPQHCPYRLCLLLVLSLPTGSACLHDCRHQSQHGRRQRRAPRLRDGGCCGLLLGRLPTPCRLWC